MRSTSTKAWRGRKKFILKNSSRRRTRARVSLLSSKNDRRNGQANRTRFHADQSRVRQDALPLRPPDVPYTHLWGIAGFLGCAYFAWVSFSHVLRNEFDWPHDAWTAATYLVWILLRGRSRGRYALPSRTHVLCVARKFSGRLRTNSVARRSVADVRTARMGRVLSGPWRRY